MSALIIYNQGLRRFLKSFLIFDEKLQKGNAKQEKQKAGGGDNVYQLCNSIKKPFSHNKHRLRDN
jgi:hypothetical protein